MPASIGVRSIRIPLPFVLSTSTIYVVESDAGLCLIDAGIKTEEAWSALTNGLAVIDRRVEDVKQVVLTHWHPDHFGLAGRIKDTSGAEILLHQNEMAQALRMSEANMADMMQSALHTFASHGLPMAVTGGFAKGLPMRGQMEVKVQVDRQLSDGDLIDLGRRKLKVIWTPGHSPGHICLLDEENELLFAGDHLLLDITPHIGSLGEQGDYDPLAEFLQSLERTAAINTRKVLPAHGPEFASARQRSLEILRHHEARLTAIRTTLDDAAKTAFETSRVVFGQDLELFQRHMAFMETLAHLDYLVAKGEVRRNDRGGLVLFSRSAMPPRTMTKTN